MLASHGVTSVRCVLQVTESLIVEVMVGLSVDYCAHFSEAYCHSHRRLRLGRLHHAIEHVGQSVLSGWAMSFGAAACLVPCTVVVLTQFGVIMCITTTISLVYSMGFFLPCLAIIGPQNNVGDVTHLVKTLRSYCRGRGAPVNSGNTKTESHDV